MCSRLWHYVDIQNALFGVDQSRFQVKMPEAESRFERAVHAGSVYQTFPGEDPGEYIVGYCR